MLNELALGFLINTSPGGFNGGSKEEENFSGLLSLSAISLGVAIVKREESVNIGIETG